MAENVAVSMARFDDNFLTVLRNGMIDYAKTLDGVNLQVEDAQNDVAKQLDQIKNFVASGVDAIIVNPVDTSATQAMSDAAAAGKIPLVYVNREPVNVDTLPDNQAFVASNERDSARWKRRRSAACSRRPARPRQTSTSSWASSRTRPPCSAPRISTT